MPRYKLTGCQRRTLVMVLDGLTDQEIAAREVCSASAVRSRVERLRRAYGARSRTDLVRLARDRPVTGLTVVQHAYLEHFDRVLRGEAAPALGYLRDAVLAEAGVDPGLAGAARPRDLLRDVLSERWMG